MAEVGENEAIEASPSPRSNPLINLFSNRLVQIGTGVGVALIIILIGVGFVLRGGNAPKAQSPTSATLLQCLHAGVLPAPN